MSKSSVDGRQVVAELAELARAPREEGTPPRPLVAGTFVMYPTEDGGLILVTDVADNAALPGVEPGVKHTRVRPAMVRFAVGLLAGKGLGGLMRRMGSGDE